MTRNIFCRAIGLLLLLISSVTTAAAQQEGPTKADATTYDFTIDQSPYDITLFNSREGEDQKRLWSQTKLLFGLSFGAIGVISILPSDISAWDSSDESLGSKWWNNVSQGWIWDKDVWYINYIGHPYFGGVYYQVARKSGYNQWNSFVYSALMSTFYWEYGLEAFAEIPSVQDIFVTPIGGWIYGEWAYQQEKEIVADGGKALGSESLGSIALFFLDPVDKIGSGINSLFGKRVIRTGTGMLSRYPTHSPAYAANTIKDYWGVDLVFTF
jgi:hypothetical protein